ncbi:AAA family ATPase [bacterium]|nr:AAA family ATPase [bacterium]
MADLKTIIFTRQESTLQLLQSYIGEIEGVSFLASTDDCDKAVNALKELNNALFVVDLSEYEEEVLNMANKVSSANPKIKIIGLSLKNDTNTYIKAMRSGIEEVLQIPIVKDKFIEAIKTKDDSESKQQKGKTISIFSNKGGVGKTSMAMNLALELAKCTKENIALLDLNFQLGDVATFWNLNPTFNISYMLENSNKLSKDFMLSAFEKYDNTSLYILANPPFYKSADRVSVENIEKLVSAMQKVFSYIIIDTSTGFGNKIMKVLEMSDLIFFMTTVSLPALRNCQKCLEMLEETGIGKDKAEIIINRYMETDDVKIEDVETLLRKKIYWKIPNNYFIMMEAINKGVPISYINSSSNVAKSYRNLALFVENNIYRKNL